MKRTDKKNLTSPQPVYCQCSCGEILSFARKPWECGSTHLDCTCGRRIKVRVLVDYKINKNKIQIIAIDPAVYEIKDLISHPDAKAIIGSAIIVRVLPAFWGIPEPLKLLSFNKISETTKGELEKYLEQFKLESPSHA